MMCFFRMAGSLRIAPVRVQMSSADAVDIRVGTRAVCLRQAGSPSFLKWTSPG